MQFTLDIRDLLRVLKFKRTGVRAGSDFWVGVFTPERPLLRTLGLTLP